MQATTSCLTYVPVSVSLQAVVSRQAELPISACLELLGGLAHLDVDCRLMFEPPGRLPAALTHLSLPLEYNIDALQPQARWGMSSSVACAGCGAQLVSAARSGWM